MEPLFWCSLAEVLYAYAGYPLLLAALARVRARPVARQPITPSLSLIVTVRNEQARVGAKLDECLRLAYPAARFELIVASDASTDRTHEIVRSYENRGVRLVITPERKGKEAAQTAAIHLATGSVIVFSDVAAQLEGDVLTRMMSNFADPSVGCVSSEDRVISIGNAPSGERMYVKYEMWLRSLESSVGSLVGLSGSFFAARREVCAQLPPDLPSDFTTLLNALRLGMRGVSAPDCIAYYPDLADRSLEYQRKVRTITRGITSLVSHIGVLNPFAYGISAWQIFSHKLCRWLVPFALCGAVISNVVLLRESPVFQATAVLQAAFYGCALFGILSRRRRSAAIRAAAFFVTSNAAILRAWCNVATGRRFVYWEPSKRTEAVTQ